MPRFRAGLAPVLDVPAVSIEYVDALQGLVRNVQSVIQAAGDAAGPPELPSLCAARAPLANVTFVHRADANALEFQPSYGLWPAPVQHVHHAAIAQGQVNGMDEPSAAVGKEANGVAVGKGGGSGHSITGEVAGLITE